MASKGTTEPGFVNRNGQINLGSTERPSTTHSNQTIYVMRCPQCAQKYGRTAATSMFVCAPYTSAASQASRSSLTSRTGAHRESWSK